MRSARTSLYRALLALAAALAALPAQAYDSIQLKKTISSPGAAHKAWSPTGVALDASGRLWVTDPANDTVDLFSPDGSLLQTIGHHGNGPGEFWQPHGIALDADGNAYIAEAGNQRVQALSPEGKPLWTFGLKGSQPGQLNHPWTIAVTPDGALAIGEKDGQRIQLFSRDGVFLQAFDTGGVVDGIAAGPSGHLFLAREAGAVEEWTAAGQMLRSYTGAEPGMRGFSKPTSAAVSPAGLVYVGDADANQFRELDPAGHVLGSFGRRGSGEGQFRALEGVAVAHEIVALADSKNHVVTLLTLSRQTPLPLAPAGSALRLRVSQRPGFNWDADRLAWNPGGSLHALSIARAQVMTVDLSKNTTSQMDLKTTLGIKTPSAIATAPSSGSLFIADAGGNRVVKLDKQGRLLLEFGKGKSFFKGGQGELSRPQGLACSPQGILYVADSGNARFDAFNHQGLFQYSSGEKGSGPGQLKEPVSLAWDREKLYVVDPGNRKVAAYNLSGRYLNEISQLGPETLVDPRQAAVDPEGNLFVLDAARGRVLVFDAQQAFIGAFGAAGLQPGFLNHPRGLALSDQDDVYLAEEGRVQVFHVVLQPPAPAALVATPGEGYVALRWEAVKTRYPAKYIVYRSTPSGEPQKVKETLETAATDDTLTPNTTYLYMIAAQSIQGATSAPSPAVPAVASGLNNRPRLEIVEAKIDDVFSSYYKYYAHTSFAHVLIRNNGSGPVEKIKLSFAIQGYMDFPTEVMVPELHSTEEKEIPIPATFNNHILEVSETTPIQAQVRLSYYSGEQEQSVVKKLPFKLYSRNSIRWDDKERFAAFVTPNDPPVQDFARALATSFAAAHEGAPLPASIVSAWAIFDGLGVYGMSYAPRPNNPYDRVSLDSTTVDTLQLARETLARKSGDCADVVALLASALESMTVTTCALDAPGHLFLMFDTGESRADLLGLPPDLLVSYAGTYWIPIEATQLGEPFMDAWKKGAEEYHRWSKLGKLSILDIHQAWQTFEPATLPETTAGPKAPAREALEEKYLADWKALVDLRWQTRLNAAKEAEAAHPSSGAPWIQMGYLAVEYHRYDEARQFFTRAQTDETTAAAASNNLGNLAFMREDWTAAEKAYRQAQTKDPSDGRIDVNLARLYLKTHRTAEASAAYGKALALDPALKEKYPDVSSLNP